MIKLLCIDINSDRLLTDLQTSMNQVKSAANSILKKVFREIFIHIKDEVHDAIQNLDAKEKRIEIVTFQTEVRFLVSTYAAPVFCLET